MARVTKVRRASSSPRERQADDIYLPSSPNEPPTSLDDVIITLYGRKNIGKSSLAAMFDGSITMMFEKGRRNLPILQVPKQGEPELTWPRAKKYQDLICNDDSILRVAIDTADQAYQACFAQICKEAGCRHPDSASKPYELWNDIRFAFEEFLLTFREAGKGVTIVSHEKVKPLVTKSAGLKRDGEETSNVKYDRMEPSFTGQVFSVVQEICDYVFYYGFKGGERCITVRSPNDVAWTACGMGDTFLDPDGNPIETFAAGKSPEEAYNNIQAAFRNELYDVDYVAPPKERVSSLPRKKKKVRT